MQRAANQLLAGVRVLDLTRILAGPFATQLLGDYGADVIKIEHPAGDDTRRWGPPFIDLDGQETACYFTAANRSKRSVALDLKQEHHHAAFHALLTTSDVLVHNFAPASIARLGLDYASLAEDHPRLVYCEITGFGSTGPEANQPGYDLVAASLGGLLHITGQPDGPPTKSGVALTDIATGLFAHGAIMAALLERERSGLGQKVETSLLESQLSILANVGVSALQADLPGQRYGNAHPSIVPYQVFATQDGYISIAATTDVQFRHLCQLLDRSDLANVVDRYGSNALRVTHRESLVQELEAAFQTATAADWTLRFKQAQAKFAFGRINNVKEAFELEQAQARHMTQTVTTRSGASINLPGHAVKFSRTPSKTSSAPPAIGAHTREILSEAGMSDAEIAAIIKTT
eukprot:TRINITY_DN11281_c0_g1_i8.p1 TRINITY_DN11281_c0_g1~~TRINITY_DN11281_c0_g1_i8.p1  ORF type:complete len:404 (+),score=77.33 TRINITY_DN11281_c0_g1_i8:112-1323(+)